MDGFAEGYRFYTENSGAAIAAFAGDAYINDIASAIETLEEDLNSFRGFNTGIGQLKGDVFEFWHSDFFNLDAVIKGSKHRTSVDRSNEFGSVDISGNFGKSFGLKDYFSGQASAHAQSVSVFQRFKEYKARGGDDSLEEFLRARGYSTDDVLDVLNDSVYSGQYRVIPKDQIEEAVKWLEEKIKTESSRRPEQIKRYTETLNMLRNRVSDGEGVASFPLTKAQSEELTRLAKEGAVSAEDLGLTTENLVKHEYIMQQALKAGLTAATI